MPLYAQDSGPGHPKMLVSVLLCNRYIPYALYLLLTGVCWQGYTFRIGPDMISYISIAQEYFAGQWWNAVNTFWSPLFSWMIAAGLATHVPVYALVRSLVVIWGLVGLAGIHRLTLQYGLPLDLSAGVVVIAAPMLASFATLEPSADFIGVCLLILYLGAICTSSSNRGRSWLLAGIIGALLYLTKAYMFGFVIAHLTFTAILRLWSSTGGSARRTILCNYIGAIACFLALSCPWLVLISLKAGHPTISATGAWNYAKARMDPRWFPQLTEGLFPPPNPASVSIWEDPGRMHIPSWNPLASAKSVRWQIYRTLTNCLYFLYFMIRASVFSVIIVSFFVWVTLRGIRRKQLFDSWACLLSAYVIYPLGYIPIALGEQRYVWIENILLLLMGACVANVIRTHITSEPRIVTVAIVLAGLSFWCDPLATVVYHWDEGHDVHSLAESLRPFGLSGNVASNGQWRDSLYLCYELGLRYYGIPKQESTSDVERELRNEGMNYLLIWNDVGTAVPVLDRLCSFFSSQRLSCSPAGSTRGGISGDGTPLRSEQHNWIGGRWPRADQAYERSDLGQEFVVTRRLRICALSTAKR
jgi:hypothetical protein